MVLGLDAGKVRDHSALVVVERMEHLSATSEHVKGWCDWFWTDSTDHYWVRALHRWPLGTPYPVVIEELGRLLNPNGGDYPDARLFFDATGVGQAVEDMVRDAHYADRLGVRYPHSITITSGSDERPGYVPKVNLIATLRRLLSEDRLHVPRSLPLAAQLRAELSDFAMTLSASGRETYGARAEATHDDLVIALALACHAHPSGEARHFLPDAIPQ